MGQALYRGYRPRDFSEVVGQDHIVTTLKRAIASGRISHAYLFTGPRGVGKTSIARILAHEINGLPYSDESIHLDIIEIDAASNNGVENIRDLREKVHVSPSSAKYKVYIIDEVHMLSKGAFNALLKTLEEPPAHAIFILATTEAHKLPETIISRTQRFEFKPISKNHAAEHLASIAEREKIKIDKEALELLAEHGEGSFRDSIGLLDQLSGNGGEISSSDVRDFLGLPPAELVSQLLSSVSSGDTAGTLSALDELKVRGANPALIARLLAKDLRETLINDPNAAWAAKLLRSLIEVPASYRPDDALEIAVLEACANNSKPSERSETVPASVKAAPKIAEPAPAPVKETAKPASEKPKKPEKNARTFATLDNQAWEEVLSRVKAEAASLYTALRLATPQFEDDKVVLAFQFPLHQKKLARAEARDLISKVVNGVTGQKLTIEAVVDKTKVNKAEPPREEAPVPEPTDEAFGTISNIFGSAEVIES